MTAEGEEESLDNIKQYYVHCETPEAKYQSIANIYGVVTIGQAMIFCHTRKTAGWLVEKMTAEGHAVALLSGELTIDQRIQVRERRTVRPTCTGLGELGGLASMVLQ